jgi:hypothetical protein
MSNMNKTPAPQSEMLPDACERISNAVGRIGDDVDGSMETLLRIVDDGSPEMSAIIRLVTRVLERAKDEAYRQRDELHTLSRRGAA